VKLRADSRSAGASPGPLQARSRGAFLLRALPPGGKGRRSLQCLDCDRPDPLKSDDTLSMAFERAVAAEVLSTKVHIMSATGLTVRPNTFYCHAMAQMQNRNVSGV
jgi:hypothetical protein